MEMKGCGGCSNSSKNNGGDDANSSVVAMDLCTDDDVVMTPGDNDGNGGSTSQDRQDDMQQGNELMEIDDDNDDGDDDEEEEVESRDGGHSEDASYRTCRRVYQHPYFSRNGHFHHCPRLSVVGRRLLSFAGRFKKNLDLERFVRVYDVGESFVIAP